MTRKPVLIWTVAACVLACSAFAQDSENDHPKRATKIPSAGFWPTRRMMDRTIDRITEAMGEEYEFDEDQLAATRDLFRDRFPAFLNENRAEIQTLVNEYFEALLNDEAPSIEEVADWAQRVQPLLAEFAEVSRDTTESMRDYLTDEQMTLLDAQMAAFETGITMAQNKLSVWADGGYDPETEWIRSSHTRPDDQPGNPGASAEQEVADTSETAQAAANVPKDEWVVYTEEFVRRYQLNDEQKQKAYTWLRERQEARDRYLARKAADMLRVSKLLEEAKTEGESKAALDAYKKLNAPVDRMFIMLKDRLDTLPTRAQRKAAAVAEPANSSTKPSTSPKAPTSAESPQPDNGKTPAEPGAAKPAGRPHDDE